VNGWIIRIEPNLVDADGTGPDSSKVMFHHGVWINQSGYRSGCSTNFHGTGEDGRLPIRRTRTTPAGTLGRRT